MSSFDPISLFPSLTTEHSDVDFTDEGRCSFVDILRYKAEGERQVDVETTKGKLGAGGLKEWISKVCPQSTFLTLLTDQKIELEKKQ